jgi:hypothetical protein
MSIFGLFHPEKLMTGVARSAGLQVAVSVCDSPGQSVIWLSLPDRGLQLAVPGELSSCRGAPGTSARAKKPTVGVALSRLTADHDLSGTSTAFS